jgi:tetratricopeptide (TPR) repeat protein
MELEDRIDELWQLLRADSPRGAGVRRRVAAMAAMAAFLLALLASVGFLTIVLFLVAIGAAGTGVVGIVLLGRRHAPQLVDRGSVVRARTAEVAAVSEAATKKAATEIGRFASRAGTDARASIHEHIPRLRSRWSRTQAALVGQLPVVIAEARRHFDAAAAHLPKPDDGWPTREPVDYHREALRANAAGSQLRRDGAYAEAAEQHRVALELFRQLGDRRAEALTLNNLALALDRVGDSIALDLFEEAATILGELGEDQQEGQVIANLALAFRRRGRDEQSAEVLEIALGKLNPDSQEYRRLDELRRAS